MKRSKLLNQPDAKGRLNIPCADSGRALSEKIVQAVFGYRLYVGMGLGVLDTTPKVKITKLHGPYPIRMGYFRSFVGHLLYFFLLRIFILAWQSH
jgi:hypothetical protein